MSEFKHIAVTAAEDDDVVIRAGIADADSVAQAESVTQSVPDFAAAQAPKQAVDSAAQAPKQAVDSAVESMPESQVVRPIEAIGSIEPGKERASHPKPESGNQAPHRTAKADSYHETTLADLESEPMPFAQKGVIIAAVVCIIGALVYYFVFMG
jgi:phage/plasmid primase-like uncharacterized protein